MASPETDDTAPLPKPSLLSPEPVPPTVTSAIREALPTVIGWLNEIKAADVAGVPPFDPANPPKKPDDTKPEQA